MNQQIIDYLNQNKDNFSQENLVNQLREAGYQESEIQEVIDFVYRIADVPISEPVDAAEHRSEKRKIITGKKVLAIVGVFIFIFISIFIISTLFGYIPVNKELSNNYYYNNFLRQEVYFIIDGNSFEGSVEHMNVDIASFEVFDSLYAKDKNNVYFYNHRIPGADPLTIKRIKPEFTKGELRDAHLAKDKNNVYVGQCVLSDIDFDDIEYVIAKDPFYKDGRFSVIYVKDKNNVYPVWGEEFSNKCSQAIKYADSETFEVLGENRYAKDKQRVYFRNRVVHGADPETFVNFYATYAKDKNGVYCRGEILEIDSKTFMSEFNEDKFSVRQYCPDTSPL